MIQEIRVALGVVHHKHHRAFRNFIKTGDLGCSDFGDYLRLSHRVQEATEHLLPLQPEDVRERILGGLSYVRHRDERLRRQRHIETAAAIQLVEPEYREQFRVLIDSGELLPEFQVHVSRCRHCTEAMIWVGDIAMDGFQDFAVALRGPDRDPGPGKSFLAFLRSLRPQT